MLKFDTQTTPGVWTEFRGLGVWMIYVTRRTRRASPKSTVEEYTRNLIVAHRSCLPIGFFLPTVFWTQNFVWTQNLFCDQNFFSGSKLFLRFFIRAKIYFRPKFFYNQIFFTLESILVKT